MSSMQKNRYQEMRERHQAEVNDFPLMFAFDARQFAEGLCRLGLRSSDKDRHRRFLPKERFTGAERHVCPAP